MPSGGVEFRISEMPWNEVTRRFASELKRRMAVVRRTFVVAAARKAKDVIDFSLPMGKEYDEFRDTLVVREIDGLDGETESASALLLKTTGVTRELRDLPKDRTLIIVGRPNPKIQPPPEEIFVLRAENPWTLDTIPFVPKAGVAKLKFRLVTEKEVERIRKAKEKVMTDVFAALEKLGVEPSQDVKRRDTAKGPPGDLPALSLGTEFGLPGFKPAAHWRPAQYEVRLRFPRLFFAHRDIMRTIMDPEYRDWQQMERSHLVRAIGLSRALDLKAFQNKVRVKAT